MDYTVVSYVIYLAISLRITAWVGNTLFENGRLFLVDAFHGNEQLADAVNQLLLVGFYLINLGYISLMLQLGDAPQNVQQVFEFLSWKIGLVLLILGAMHFLNLYIFNRYRNAALEDQTVPPVRPDGVVAHA